MRFETILTVVSQRVINWARFLTTTEMNQVFVSWWHTIISIIYIIIVQNLIIVYEVCIVRSKMKGKTFLEKRRQLISFHFDVMLKDYQ